MLNVAGVEQNISPATESERLTTAAYGEPVSECEQESVPPPTRLPW